jgi:putative nucleotidyltransferase with HDIG domain
MLITIMFDSRIGFYATVIYSLVCGATRGNDYPFVVMNIVAGALGVYTVRDIRNRVQIFRSFVYILIGYAITILAFGLERYDNFANIVTELGVAATNALISPVLTYGLLVFFEKIFHITTELTLLELSNSDHPLLRELAKKAPGSFSHSMQMGLLAESAALSIGANSLLARVGAYYHDIGKIYSPKVFVENQAKGVNIHDELRPEDSVRALKEHILRGKERAKKFGLPEEIIDFIPMHHGTTVMSFFYEKAKKFYGEDEVNIADYRYAGPKPNTKDTAIVMLADTCESAVRSIEAPDWSKVDNLVNNLIDRRIEDGQLDESQLTLGDIQRVQTAFVEVLAGQTSVRRIRYPEQDDLEKSE